MLSPIKQWRNQKKLVKLIGKRGVLLYTTIIRVPPEQFSSEAPYMVGIVEIEGKRYTGQVVGIYGDTVAHNTSVCAVIRRLYQTHKNDIIPYGIKFCIL